MLIKACLNGRRTPDEHPTVPLAAEALAADAQRVVAAGAGALHVHPRDASGAESLAAQDVAAALTAIRLSCPGVPVGVSTGIWIASNARDRLRLIEEWTVLPDFVSVNFSEPETAELCTHLLSRGVGIEAGIWSVEDAQLLRTLGPPRNGLEGPPLGIADRCLRVLIELQEPELGPALATAEAILRCLDEGNIRLPILLHGDHEVIVWPVLEVALQRGYDTRIGLEDTLCLPDGSRAKDNAELVSVAVSKAREIGAL